MTAFLVDSGSEDAMLSRCDVCGSELKITAPVPIGDFVTQTRAFAKAHERCQPRGAIRPTEPPGESPDATSDR